MFAHRALQVVLAGLVTVALLGCNEPTKRRGSVDDERWLEARLIAPCCWMQTLDVHESPVAQELRSEIHARLSAGEAPLAIEDDIVARYGESIRALPKGKDPRTLILVFVAALVLAVGVGLARLARGWTLAAAPVVQARGTATARDALDDQLDEELRDLDG
jgi:cytochrome c-type biogenesis protein CcmH